MNSEDAGNALRRLALLVGALSDDELTKIADEAYHIELKITKKRARDENVEGDVEDTKLLIGRLSAFLNREAAVEYLSSGHATRKALEPLARALDIPIMKQDKTENLRDKIVEATVGARIRSLAIQGSDE
jgi:hypothetical protein